MEASSPSPEYAGASSATCCSNSSGLLPPAVSPTTRNRSGLARTMSSAWVPIDPVDPRTTTSRTPPSSPTLTAPQAGSPRAVDRRQHLGVVLRSGRGAQPDPAGVRRLPARLAVSTADRHVVEGHTLRLTVTLDGEAGRDTSVRLALRRREAGSGSRCGSRTASDCAPRTGRPPSSSRTAATSLTRMNGGPSLPQQRNLVTEIPGPESLARLDRKKAHVADGVGTMLPVFVTAAGGGVLVDVDGNSLIDLGSGIAVTSVGNARRVGGRPRAGAGGGVHAHLLHDHAVRRLRGRVRAAGRAHARATTRRSRRCSTPAPRRSRTP